MSINNLMLAWQASTIREDFNKDTFIDFVNDNTVTETKGRVARRCAMFAYIAAHLTLSHTDQVRIEEINN